MISIKDFKVLPFEKKCDFITVFGNYLACRSETERKFFLYNLGRFFTEVEFSVEGNTVHSISCFNQMECLDPYLSLIDISDLSE